MYSVKIGNIPELCDTNDIFETACKNCKSIIGAKICHNTKIMDGLTYEVSYMLEIYFSNQQEAIMYELKYL